MPTPDPFLCLILPIVIIVAGGIAGLAGFLRTNPRSNTEHPHNPGGAPWGN